MEMAEDGASASAGAIRELLSHLLPGQARHVRSFEEDARHYGPLNRRPLGLRPIPLDRIVGSVGRARELGPDFRPIGGWKHRRAMRYERVRDALKRGQTLPPVELYKLGYNYYVVDGHHRVAAMKEIAGDEGEIDAHVTQFLPAGDTEASRVYLERRTFEEATGLKQVGAVERGHYPALKREIERYRAEVEAATSRAMPLKEAAGDWFITVWLPRAEQIRRSGLRRRWPEKRTADIYVYIREHQAAESARQGRPLSWDDAFADFKARTLGAPRSRLPKLARRLRLSLPFRPGRAAGAPLPRPPDDNDPEARPEVVGSDLSPDG
jgi:hypothetical protein